MQLHYVVKLNENFIEHKNDAILWGSAVTHTGLYS